MIHQPLRSQNRQRMQLPDPFQNDHNQGRNNYLNSVEVMILFTEEETGE